MAWVAWASRRRCARRLPGGEGRGDGETRRSGSWGTGLGYRCWIGEVMEEQVRNGASIAQYREAKEGG